MVWPTSAWLAEGLLLYLTADEATRLSTEASPEDRPLRLVPAEDALKPWRHSS